MSITRRELIAGAAAGFAPCIRMHAQAQLRFIDTHHHIVPPRYLREVGSANIGGPAGRPAAPDWSPAMSLDAMDAIGIQTAVTSISAPGFPFRDPKTLRRVARDANEYARQLRDDHPGRFGVFAAMPLPDVPAAIDEATFALETLQADGIGLLTSYDGSYLGDAHFAPFFDEMQRRKAVVYVHPSPCSCSAGVNTGLAPSAIEYPHETTRTMASLLFNGTFDRCPDVRFIFSHAGGTMPYIVNRIANRKTEKAPDPAGTLKRLYHDVAQAVNPVTLAALLSYAGPGRVVFGTDFPFVGREPSASSAALLAKLADGKLMDEAALRAIARDNALSLLPRLKR